MGRNSVRTSDRTSARPLFGWSNHPICKESEGKLEGFEGLLEWSGGQPAGSEGQPEGGWTDVRTDGRTDVRTEFLPILQDFLPCRGRCPKKGEEKMEERKKWKEKERKNEKEKKNRESTEKEK